MQVSQLPHKTPSAADALELHSQDIPKAGQSSLAGRAFRAKTSGQLMSKQIGENEVEQAASVLSPPFLNYSRPASHSLRLQLPKFRFMSEGLPSLGVQHPHPPPQGRLGFIMSLQHKPNVASGVKSRLRSIAGV
jgi:hypothetical protein